MANVNRDGGLRLVRANVSQELVTCVHASGDSVRLGKGDPVKTAGSSAQVGGGPYMKTVALCASGDAIYGVVEGFDPLIPTGMNLDLNYVPASTAQYVLVRVANPFDIYAITEDGTLAVADIGQNADITGNGGGTTVTACSTTTGESTVKLDTSTAAASTGTLKTIGYESRPDNTPGSANSSILVQINECESVGSGSNGV